MLRCYYHLPELNISEGPEYAPFNCLGQCLNVTLLDLVAVVDSLLTSCNIQLNPIKYSKKTNYNVD